MRIVDHALRMIYRYSGVARVWQSVALATPIFSRLLDKLNFLLSLSKKNAKSVPATLNHGYKIKYHPPLFNTL